MSNEELIREIAGRAWNEALLERAPELAADVARRMNGAIAARISQASVCGPLRDGARAIAASRTQTEALEALLAACARITPACGLLVLRGTQATGWSCLGLSSLDNFKRAVLDCSCGAPSVVLSSVAPHAGKASELDAAFLKSLGLRGGEDILLLPVLLKERIAALLLALSASQDDLAALEALVCTTQLVLDLQTYRKAVPAPAVTEAARPPAAQQPDEAATPAAAATETYQAASASASAPASSSAAAPAEADSGGYAPATVAVEAPPAAESAAPAASSDQTHDRARRFAKLLVEEIKLYNQSKVNEGREHCDLYSRLREDVEKSRAVYQKRYAETVTDVDYFTQELVRILADNNREAMGAEFPG